MCEEDLAVPTNVGKIRVMILLRIVILKIIKAMKMCVFGYLWYYAP